jgi:hypothetical protein
VADERVQLHMTMTSRNYLFGEWVAYCRCGWTGSYLDRQEDSRSEGDRHLTEANAAPPND